MSYNGRKTNIFASKNIKDVGIQFNHNYSRSDQYRDNNDYKLDSTSLKLSSIGDKGTYTFLNFKKFGPFAATVILQDLYILFT